MRRPRAHERVPQNEDVILKIRNSMVNIFLASGFSVIIDDTNLAPKHQEAVKRIIDNFNLQYNKNVQFEIDFIRTPIEECIRRDASRITKVGEKVIYRMYKDYKHLYNFDDINPIVQDENLPHAIIVDVDGTIARMKTRNPFEWDKVDQDEPIESIIKIVQMFNEKDYSILFVSGRDAVCAEKTWKWIEKHVLAYEGVEHHKLIMRKEGDMRADEIVKKELFEEHIKDRYYIECVFDDRNKVVKAWRQIGLTCLQVAEGNF